jgi:ribosomal protein S18 acetylase RimI-like enzyme
MEPAVRRTWASDEAVERYFVVNRFDPARTKIIQWNGVDVGRVTVVWSPGEAFIEQIHVLPECQGLGVGTAVLEGLIHLARVMKRSVRLKCLCANPALALYVRVGFQEYDRNDTHCFLRISAGGTRSWQE